MSGATSTAFIKVVELPKARVVSSHVKDNMTPEEVASLLLERWGRPRGINDLKIILCGYKSQVRLSLKEHRQVHPGSTTN